MNVVHDVSTETSLPILPVHVRMRKDPLITSSF